MSSSIVRYLNPWKHKREEAQQRRLSEVRKRDGDRCRRCRRALRFDLPEGHDQAAKLEPIVPAANGGSEALDNFVLTHARCNAVAVDHTSEVVERVRAKNQAELFAKSRKRRKKAA